MGRALDEQGPVGWGRVAFLRDKHEAKGREELQPSQQETCPRRALGRPGRLPGSSPGTGGDRSPWT